MQKTFLIDTMEFLEKFKRAINGPYLEGRVDVIPGILWFVVYPNKTHVIICVEEKGGEE